MANHVQDEDDDRGLFTNKSTMMANFEQWIKMATDNKINSSNSWNFALIDYFYDLNVLKDSEDNINFQKASATLDGCVKIYSSRVDSVANETGILLSGLAQRKHQQTAQGENADDAGATGSNQGAEGGVTIDPTTGLPISNEVDNISRRRNYNRVLETTLVDFENLRMRELDQELSIDPLFKKALADFDEGGAKSLLINTLHIDSSARIVFDATTSHELQKNPNHNAVQADVSAEIVGLITKDGDGDVIMDEDHSEDYETNDKSVLQENTPEAHSMAMEASEPIANQSIDVEDEILALGMDLIDFRLINEAEICPSMKKLRDVVTDVHKAKSFIDDVNKEFDNFLTDQDLQDAMPDAADENEANFDIPADNSFGMNGEYYDDENSANNDQDGTALTNISAMAEGEKSAPDITTSVMDRDVMAYFDETMKTSWRGREHWKIRNFKNRMQAAAGETPKPDGEANEGEATEKDKEAPKAKKPIKQKLSIDFFNFDHTMEERIFDKKKSNIEMPQKLRTNSTHYLLPNDYQFSTEKITRLFIKPAQQMSFFSHRKPAADYPRVGGTIKIDETDINEGSEIPGLADQNFWAQNYQMREQDKADEVDGPHEMEFPENDLPNPFDDNDGGIDFNQAFGTDGLDDSNSASLDLRAGGSAGLAQPLGKPDVKVTYSRVSKKVDVKRLKDNIWSSISKAVKERLGQEEAEQSTTSEIGGAESGAIVKLNFTDITERISKMYSGERKKDLSTSFCFICLLHLANEHGFAVEPTEEFDDLAVKIERLVAISESSEAYS
ncbi:LANO_0F12244g1_1 [Lachancea nothofagi CBS 11611]|uniref:Condensin complex subunit 2 n=1 Tax=Lachancea nothofagi CBS 11611 TaxID=1266666 RepID=A0A1G4KBA0_9SACH|nr:LANO_0F12244g1_1 [Lachancea nothofagi CBS 11611]